MQQVCSKCDTCQRLKRSNKKYGKLPPKEAEAQPWDTLCVDLIGKYQFTTKSDDNKNKSSSKTKPKN